MPASTKRPGQGMMTTPPAKGTKPSANRKPKQPSQPKYQYLNKRQNKTINQTNTGDIGLGNTALKQMPGIENSYSQPFDYAGGPQAPVTGDYNQWVDNQMGTYANAYDQRMNPVEKQQNEDFEQQMANRGIGMGNPLYDQQKKLLLQSQNDARTQAFASGQQNAISGATSLFNVGTQARGNYVNEGLQQRNQSLTDYQNLMGARSQMPMQNLQYSQGRQSQKQAEDASMAQTQAQIQAQMALASMKGSGGGGGAPKQQIWDYYGMTPEQYDQYQIDLANQNKPKPVNPYASIIGSVVGAGISGAASGYFGK